MEARPTAPPGTGRTITSLTPRSAADGGWSSAELVGAIRTEKADVPSSGVKKRRGGGQKFRKPKDPREALRKLVELSRSWLKYYPDIGADGGQSILLRIADVGPGGQDAGFLEELRAAKDVLKEVERAARKAAGQLQEAEGKLQPHPTGGTEGSTGKPRGSKEGEKGRPSHG